MRAYKGLVKEKETLETSLKVITAATDDQVLLACMNSRADPDTPRIHIISSAPVPVMDPVGSIRLKSWENQIINSQIKRFKNFL